MGAFRRRWPGVSYGRGEDWHYVGEAGEPAFGGNWVNSGDTSDPATSFRIREAGLVDLNISAQNTVDAFLDSIFTLPESYRPSRLSYTQTAWGRAGVSTGGSHAGLLKIQTNGQVTPVAFIDEAGSNVVVQQIFGQFMFYLDPPIAIADL